MKCLTLVLLKKVEERSNSRSDEENKDNREKSR